MTGSRDLRRWLAGAALAGLLGGGSALAQSDGLAGPDAFAGIADPAARSVALFEEAGKVLQHPRCVNCHPAGDRPLQNDEMRLHQPPVQRGDGGLGVAGMRCFTCHQQQNYDAAGVPGHPLWHLAPIEMAWQGRSLGQICEQIKDVERNGGKTLAEIHEHMAEDSLVGWGWNPDAGRAPVPGTQGIFGELIGAWIDSGAHCPTS
jgi:hypothetical protein